MRWHDQRGSTSALFLFMWTIVLLTVAFAADFGRIFFLREQLRTAEDAAALAGALQLEYKVQMRFARERRVSDRICKELIEDPAVDCWWEESWEPAPDLLFEGWEDEAWQELARTWGAVCMSGEYRCTPAYKKPPQCWIEAAEGDAAVTQTARSIFHQNKVWGDQATLRSLQVDLAKEGFAGPGRPQRIKVIVGGELEMKTYLLAALGVKQLPVKTLEHPPQLATAELVRRGEKRKVYLGKTELTSPCDIG